MSSNMTQEEKQLLLKDLCGRLPYGVKLGFENSDLILVPKEFNIYTMQLFTVQIYPESDSMVIGHVYDVWNYRPYLRSMSNMTEEERKDWYRQSKVDYDCEFQPEPTLALENCHLSIDWLNEKGFDYRGLIEKDLALEAKEGIYKV